MSFRGQACHSEEALGPTKNLPAKAAAGRWKSDNRSSNSDFIKQSYRFPAGQFSSGCCPSWAFHMHSVTFMSVNTAVKEDSSGEQA